MFFLLSREKNKCEIVAVLLMEPVAQTLEPSPFFRKAAFTTFVLVFVVMQSNL